MKSTQAEIIAFLQAEFPQSLEKCEIETLTEKGASIIYYVGAADLRPGGTVSGPSMMTAADYALYIAILGEIGIVALAVTTNLSINFLKKPSAAQNIRAVCKLMKVGKALIVGDVWLYSINLDDPIAHVVGTYAIPAQS